jgi:diaminopimelate decarboxylase
MIFSEAEAYSRLYGDAFYLYDEARFDANFNGLLSAFRRYYPGTQLAYSYKTNYMPAICQRVDALGGYAEVVSAMEYALARRIGVHASKIVYNGPWKSEASVREALTSGGIVNLDSDRDLLLLQQVAPEARDMRMRVGMRCNFPLEGYADSRFGFDVDGESFRAAVAAIRRLPNVILAGLHCHFPHRELRSFSGRATRIIDVAQRLFDAPPEYISIGGGFYGHMPDDMKEKVAEGVPSFEDYGRAVGQAFASAYGKSGGTPTLFIEPGTATVADTFRFVARVIDLKQIRSRRLACLAGSLFNISPYARSQGLPVTVLHRAEAEAAMSADEACDLVGYTCIEGDVLSRGVRGPLSVGDYAVFSNVGSYSVVMKPPFILPSVPIVMRLANGESRLAKRAETNEYLLENFVF